MPEDPHTDDELLSSHLDGELTIDEQARLDDRLAAEPALRARLAALHDARTLVGSAVSPLTAAEADGMIGAALAASATASNVTDLSAATSRRSIWPSRLAVAAAAVVALALAVPALRALDRGTDSDTAATVADADDSFDGDMEAGDGTAADMATEAFALDDSPAAAGDDATDDADAAGSDISEAAEVPPDDEAQRPFYDAASTALFVEVAGFDPLVDDLGEFLSTATLSSAVSEDWTAERSTADPTTTTGPVLPTDVGGVVDPEAFLADAFGRFDGLATIPCAGIVDVIVDYFAGDTVLAADYASAIVAGAPTTVGVFLRADGSGELLVVDQATCTVTSARLG
ncbi:MAG: hypothetical protein R2707_17135 [Acidimicrobiales bacterium]